MENIIKETSETPIYNRDFKSFLAEHPKIKFDTDRKNTMQVGDYIEMPMEAFKRWVDINKLNPSVKQMRGDIEDTLKTKNFSSDDSKIVKVCISDIEENGEYPRLYITVEADGMQKRIYSSLFYNFFANHTTDLDIITSSNNAGFSESGPTHIIPESGDSILW